MIAKLKATPLQTEQYIKENAFSSELLLAKNNEWQEKQKNGKLFFNSRKIPTHKPCQLPF